jgi:hypothetical protein
MPPASARNHPAAYAQTAPAELAPVDVIGERAGSYKSSSVQVGGSAAGDQHMVMAAAGALDFVQRLIGLARQRLHADAA